jgi:hypothetical protein
MKALTLERLTEVWEKILKDEDARQALAVLEEHGFKISHLRPQDPSFQYPSWADYFAAIPLVPYRPSRRRIHSKMYLQKYRPLIGTMLRFAENLNNPFREVVIRRDRDSSLGEGRRLKKSLITHARFLTHFLSWDWYIRDRNPRNAIIAELRWTIRWRTGKPHDRELAVLIDAAFRAAGLKGLYLDNTTLDRIEKREKEGRVKAMRRLSGLALRSPKRT